MAEKSASERTEKATPERLRKAREKGQIPESKEVSSAVMIGALLVAMALGAERLFGWLTLQVSEGLSLSLAGPMDVRTFVHLLQTRATGCLTALAPFLAVTVVASAFGSMAVGGWAFSVKALKPDMSRLSPIKGLKNLFSFRSIMQLLIATVKLAVIVAIAWHYLGSRFDAVLLLQWATPQATLYAIGRLILGLVARIVVALVAIALVDMLYQRWNYKRQLRMTHQEVKEERRQHEASPEIKGRIRAAQLAAARRRMLQEVPTADVVVTNPDHYAVALRYDAETMDAPRVVAKGADFLCQKIKEVARKHNVPIVERPHLARALYTAVEVDQVVPETLFVAVAEVLAMIYRMRRKTQTSRQGRS